MMWFSFHSDDTSLFGMLQIEPMTFGDFAIDRAFHPSQGIYYFVIPFLHEFYREC